MASELLRCSFGLPEQLRPGRCRPVPKRGLPGGTHTRFGLSSPSGSSHKLVLSWMGALHGILKAAWKMQAARTAQTPGRRRPRAASLPPCLQGSPTVAARSVPPSAALMGAEETEANAAGPTPGDEAKRAESGKITFVLDTTRGKENKSETFMPQGNKTSKQKPTHKIKQQTNLAAVPH